MNPVKKELVSQPTIFEGSRGPSLAIASGEGDIPVLVLATGQDGGSFNTDGKGVKSSPLLIGDVLFVHTDTGQLRQYQTSTLSQINCVEAKGEGKPC